MQKLFDIFSNCLLHIYKKCCILTHVGRTSIKNPMPKIYFYTKIYNTKYHRFCQ